MSCIENVHTNQLSVSENAEKEVNINKDEVSHFEKEAEADIECAKGKGNSCCPGDAGFKETHVSFTLDDLELKRLELIRLQKEILNLHHSRQKTRRLNAKCHRLSINSKYNFGCPPIKLNVENQRKFNIQNELVNSELQFISRNAFNQAQPDIFQLQKETYIKSFRSREESFYKVFHGSVEFLMGEMKNVLVLLSSGRLYIMNKSLQQTIFEVLYEEIETIFVGEHGRWVAITNRDSKTASWSGRPYFQVDVGDSDTARDLIIFLELAVRRRLVSLRKLNKAPVVGTSNFRFSLARRFFSFGRVLEPLVPPVVDCSTQEVAYIEQWVKEELKLKEKPHVLACWLVFWESGSEFWSEEDVDPSPCFEGFLMVTDSLQNTWMPAYFLLKGGILYQFHDPCDKLPLGVIRIAQFCGCRRLPFESRPYSFELLGKEGNSVYFAAPNEETASLWLQSFLRLISIGDEDFKERRKFRPCQLIQTMDHLILCYQSSILAVLQSFHSKNTRRKGKNPPVRFETKEFFAQVLPSNRARHSAFRSSPVHSNQGLKFNTRNSLRNILVSSKVNTSCQLSTSVPNSSLCQNSSSKLESPPTPPLPQIPAVSPLLETGVSCNAAVRSSHTRADVQMENEIASSTSQSSLRLLASCSIDQISEIIMTSWSKNCCLMEFECSEAKEIVGDWALYFSSDEQTGIFLNSVLKCRECLTGVLLGISKISSGRVHQLLLKGSSLSKEFWKPQW